jgi:hypothetical protein
MADPFGIIGVIGVAAHILQATVQLGVDWKETPLDAKAFIGELQALKSVLSETSTNIVLNKDFLDAFEGRHSTVLSQLGSTESTTDTRSLISACQSELEILLEDLKKRSQGRRAGWERMKGAFLSKKTRETVENLHRHCKTLNSVVAIDIAALAANTHNVVTDIRNRHERRDVSEEETAILSWLTKTDYTTQQSDYTRRRQPGTGGWLLDSPKFQSWVHTEKQTIFCPGIPGAGKTILTAIVIEYLTNQHGDDPNVGIAYVYCNFKRKNEQKLDDLLASLLRQLSEKRTSTPNAVKELYEQHNSKRIRPSTDELSRTLQSVVASYSKAFIIVDALDECQISDGCQSKFIDELFNLQVQGGANLFMTSRFLPDVMENFDKACILEIRARPEDVQLYLAAQMFRLPRFVSRDAGLQEEIKSKIINAVDGM